MSRKEKQTKKQNKMAYISYVILWKVSFLIISLQKNRVQDIHPNQLKLEKNDIHREDEKTKTKFEAVNDEDVMDKAYLDTKLAKVKGDISYVEKKYNELKGYERYKEEILDEKAVKTTIQIHHDRRLFDKYDFVNEVVNVSLLIEGNERNRLGLRELNDDNVVH